MFSSIDMMVLRWDQLNFHLVLFGVFLNGLGAFIIHDVEHRLVLPCLQNVEDFHEGGDEGCASTVWHWVDDDGIKVINVCNKNVLHILEGSNRKHPGDICVHGAGRGIGKGSEAKHVMHPTRFVDGEHVVDLTACSNNVWVVVACGGSVGLKATHMAFVGCSRLGQMGVNQIWCEAGDGCQLSTLGKGKQECGGCRGTK